MRDILIFVDPHAAGAAGAGMCLTAIIVVALTIGTLTSIAKCLGATDDWWRREHRNDAIFCGVVWLMWVGGAIFGTLESLGYITK